MSLKVGIQLYSVREEMAKDPIATVKKVADVGYKYLEFANSHADTDPGVGFGVSAEELLQAIDGTGAKFISGHIRPLNDETLGPVLEYAKKIGCKYLVDAMEIFPDRETVLEKCKVFNEIGKKCKEAGIQYIYHNHFHEMQQFDGKTVLEIIADHTDPEYLSFELDTFWVLRGGRDPIEMMRILGDRVKLLHQKDFAKDADMPVNMFELIDPNAPITMETFRSHRSNLVFAEIGKGIMDIQAIIDEANRMGCIEYIILEQDYSRLGAVEGIQVSMDSFHQFNGIDFN